MADNYLEKKFEQMREGRPAAHRQVKSLDTLLKSLSEGVRPQGFAEEHSVKSAQLQAIIRSASLCGIPGVSFSEGDASIEVSGAEGFELGRIMQIILLKAAELGVSTKIIGKTAYFSK